MSLFKVFTAILLVSTLAIVSCTKAEDEDTTSPSSPTPTPIPGYPVAGTAISFSSVTISGLTVNWGAATDDETTAADLQYKLVSSTSNNISTADDAEANGTVEMDWTANTLTYTITGLPNETSYYYAVLIKDADDHVTIDTAIGSTLCNGKMIYRATVAMGNFGGAAGADAACTAQKPSSIAGAVKAMVYDSTARMACSGADCTASNTGAQDWALAANQSYCNTDYVATMASTNAFAFPTITLAGSLEASGTTSWTYTGMNSFGGGSTNNCSDWTVWANPNVGMTGRAALSGIYFYSNGDAFCATGGYVYCVEQ